MTDLLNEDEFLPKEYDPKKWFIKFYLGAFIFEIITILIFRIINLNNDALSIIIGVLTGFILPMVVSGFMILSKKEVLLDTKKSTIVKGVLLLYGCFFIPRVVSIAYNYLFIYLQEGMSNIFLMLLTPVAFMAIICTVTLAIIIPLVNRSRKIKNRMLSQ